MNENSATTPATEAAGLNPRSADLEAYRARLFGPWRDGKRLVVLKSEPLPLRCVKSNEPTAYRLRQKLTWHPLVAQLTSFAGVLESVVLYKALERSISFEVPLSKRHRIRLWLWILLGVLLIFAGLAVIVYPMSQRRPIDNGGWYVGIGMAIVLLGYERCLHGPHPLRPKRINERFAYFAGAGEDFLASLPEFIGEDELPAPQPFHPTAPPAPRSV